MFGIPVASVIEVIILLIKFWCSVTRHCQRSKTVFMPYQRRITTCNDVTIHLEHRDIVRSSIINYITKIGISANEIIRGIQRIQRIQKVYGIYPPLGIVKNGEVIEIIKSFK